MVFDYSGDMKFENKTNPLGRFVAAGGRKPYSCISKKFAALCRRRRYGGWDFAAVQQMGFPLLLGIGRQTGFKTLVNNNSAGEIMIIYATPPDSGFKFSPWRACLWAFFYGHDAHAALRRSCGRSIADSSDLPGISIFSPTVMASFVTAFGGFGLIFTQFPSTSKTIISAPLRHRLRRAGGGRHVINSSAWCSARPKAPANPGSPGWSESRPMSSRPLAPNCIPVKSVIGRSTGG